MRAGAARRSTSRRSASRATAGSTSPCTTGSASTPATGCSTWRAGLGSRSSLLGSAAPPAAASTPRPGWSRWPGIATPNADIRVGDMHALPWDEASFDVVTSFRGIWGTTPDAVAELRRVLRPGGRAGITVWGHIKVSPGAWALAPFRLAATEKVDNQAAMVSLGRPGCGRAAPRVLWVRRYRARAGAVRVGIRRPADLRAGAGCHRAGLRGHPERRRGRIPSGGGRAGPGTATGRAAAAGRDQRRRATWPANPKEPSTHDRQLSRGTPSPPQAQELFDEDLAEDGFVSNVSRLWAHQPETLQQLFALMSDAFPPSGLGFRQRGILVTAAASALGDSYCSLAWGGKLAQASDPRPGGRGPDRRRRRADRPGEGHRPLGAEGGRRPERDDARRHPGAP